MTRKLDAAQEGAAQVLSLRLPPALAAALDAEARRRADAAGVPVTVAAVARVLLERALLGAPTPATRTTTTSSTPAAQEAAQSPTTSPTPSRSSRPRAPAAAPPAASPKADDERDEARQLPLLGEADEPDDEHDRRNREHIAAGALLGEIRALRAAGESCNTIARAITAAGYPVTGRAVSGFAAGKVAGLPRWHQGFRAWRAGTGVQ